MEFAEINRLLEDLSWSNRDEVCEKAINELINIPVDYLHLLVLPNSRKDIWHNCAVVLHRIGYPKIIPIVPELLEWLKDLNWPGTKSIIDLLCTVDKTILLPHFETAIKKAKAEQDDDWIDGLIAFKGEYEKRNT